MRKQLITLIVVLASAMVVSTMARAAGETKNQAPFTRLTVQAQSEIRGEAKNDLPFTASANALPDVFERYASAHPYGAGTSAYVGNVVSQEQGAPSGEAKNDLPFTATSGSSDDGSIQWRDVVGGSAIGGVLILIALVGLQARRRSHGVPALSK